MSFTDELAAAGFAAGQAVAPEAFPAATYRRRTVPTYDTATGTAAATPVQIAITPLFDEYSDEERQNAAIKANDQRAYIRATELGIAPAVDDEIADDAGSIWTVIGVRTVPGKALWDLQVRRPS